jgi:hypothetical protein
MNPPDTGFTRFREFYPYYLERACRPHLPPSTLCRHHAGHCHRYCQPPYPQCHIALVGALWQAMDSLGWVITFSRKTGRQPLSTPFTAFGGTL